MSDHFVFGDGPIITLAGCYQSGDQVVGSYVVYYLADARSIHLYVVGFESLDHLGAGHSVLLADMRQEAFDENWEQLGGFLFCEWLGLFVESVYHGAGVIRWLL